MLQFAEVLLNKDDVDAKADALIDFIKENVVDKDFTDPMLGATHTRAVVRRSRRTGSATCCARWSRRTTRAGARTTSRRSARCATGCRTSRTRCAGLVTDDGTVSDLPFGSFEDRTVYVIDVANLEEDAQDLIFARVVSKLREHLERRDLGVKHVVVFVDELNKYAPGDGPDTYVRKMLLDIAERGRYLGLVLFSAQQFRSQVHRRVVGNSGTALYGRMDADELATPGYAVLSPAIETKLATLEKGQLMVRHPHFTQPIFVRFPRPAVMRGRDGVERYPAGGRGLAGARGRALAAPARPRITLGWVQDVTALATDDEVIRARNATLLARPDDVKTFFAVAVPAHRAAAPAHADAGATAAHHARG